MTALAKKSTAKKTARKSTAKKATDAKSASSKPRQSTRSKAAGSKAGAAKKSATKKAARKPTAKKAQTKKADAKKSTPKKATAVSNPGAKKPAAKKAARKSTASKKAKSAETTPETASPEPTERGADTPQKKPARKPTAKKAPAKQPTQDKPESGDKAGSGGDKKAGRKGITIVEPAKKAPSKGKAQSKYNPPVRPMLLGPGSTFTKPLIPSGPSAPKVTSVFDAPKSRRTKSPFSKAKLDKFRLLLIAKRAELLGDVESMENEALRSGSGGLSNTPQHLAEQGSESYDQSLSLNLAAQDRRLIKEIDEALKRIEEGTYGLCELTNQPISEDRLEELPWARYTIEAARQLETRGPRP